jgi:hypothetical protein
MKMRAKRAGRRPHPALPDAPPTGLYLIGKRLALVVDNPSPLTGHMERTIIYGDDLAAAIKHMARTVTTTLQRIAENGGRHG